MKNLVLITASFIASFAISFTASSQSMDFTMDYREVPEVENSIYVNMDAKVQLESNYRLYSSSRTKDSDSNVSTVFAEYSKMCLVAGGSPDKLSIDKVMRNLDNDGVIYVHHISKKYSSKLYISGNHIVAELFERF